MGKNNFVLSQLEDRNVFNDQEHTFKILVASDNHVGFKEDDPIRGNDSFEAFEEVLKIAKKERVDFLLLGGDLFHENNPSQQCLYRMLNMLGNNVLGDGEITYEMPNYQANFQDSNLNIELPIFIIHGNHDYPSDEYGNLSVIDLLHATKYLNHFGKFSNIETIKVTPIIFQKGNTVIALYGVGYLRDKYFHKMLEEDKIEFVKASTLGYENSVNILVIHQHRYKGVKSGQSYRNCVHSEQFPSWIDLIIRGHEHEQLDEVGNMKDCTIVTIQPGSTVLTAMEEVQATPRRAILFEIKGVQANFQDIALIQSYRPVLYENIEFISLLKKVGHNLLEETPTEEEIEEILWMHILQSFKNFKLALKENFPDNSQVQDKKPQLRFKVEHSGIDYFNPQRIEMKLSDLVANPGEVLKFWKRIIINPRSINNPKLDEEFINTLKEKNDFDTIGNDTVKDIIRSYEKRINKNKSISCLPISLIMNTIEKINLRNRKSQIEDVLTDLQTKLQGNVVSNEEESIKQINQHYKQQMSTLFQKISENINCQSNIDQNQNQNIHMNKDKIIYKTLMNNQFDDIKQNLASKIRSKVVELFIQDFQIDNQNKENDQNRNNDLMQNETDQQDEEQTEKKDDEQLINLSKQGQKIQIRRIKKQQSEDEDKDKYEGEDSDQEDIEHNEMRKKHSNGSKVVKDSNVRKDQIDFQKGERNNDNEKNKEQSKFKLKIKGKPNFSVNQMRPERQDLQLEQMNKFKKKVTTYGQLFKKQRQSENDEMEQENINLSNNEEQLSDCEFGLDEEKQTKNKSLNINHALNNNSNSISNQLNQPKTSLISLQIQSKQNKQETKSDFKFSLPIKKKPKFPQSEVEETQNTKAIDIRSFMKKKIKFINQKN